MRNSSGGKGSSKRPQLVDDKTLQNNWDSIFKPKSIDPLTECRTHKEEGCSHIDGYLCRPTECSDFKR